MKKTILASAFAVASLFSLGAFADETTICAAPTAAGAGTAPEAGMAGTHYMVVKITPKCSANVFMAGMDGDNGAWYAAGAASAKGKTAYPASTQGGGVGAGVACAVAGGCVAKDASDQRDAANTAAATAAGT